mmetsp:Transcript_86634/g.240198  ORF Transcript_86634/g.240198 Transcript_86634/m.240198 type:complete len:238 (-) Transcript_86634:741-1454(-)
MCSSGTSRSPALLLAGLKRLAPLGLDRGLHGNECLDDKILYAVEHAAIVEALPREVRAKLAQGPLRRARFLLLVLGLRGGFHPVAPIPVLDEGGRGLVDRVVGEVHGLLLERVRRGGVFLCGQADQALVVDIHLQRVIREDHDVNTQVELVPIDQQGVWHVSLDNATLAPQLLGILCAHAGAEDPDAAAAALAARLPDPQAAGLPHARGLPGYEGLGKHVGLRCDVIGPAKAALHPR